MQADDFGLHEDSVCGDGQVTSGEEYDGRYEGAGDEAAYGEGLPETIAGLDSVNERRKVVGHREVHKLFTSRMTLGGISNMGAPDALRAIR